jgi:hypothetical protein
MAPGLVWLLLIPLMNIVWVFFVVTHLKTGSRRWVRSAVSRAASNGSYGMGSPLALPLVVCLAVSIVPLIDGLALLPRAGALDHSLGDGEQGAWADEAGRRGRDHPRWGMSSLR